MPSVITPKPACETAMFEWVIHVIAGIVFARVVTYPGLAVNVGNVGVALLVAVVAIRFNRVRLCLQRFWSGSWNGWMRSSGPLRKGWDCENEQGCKS
jgi:hypothetical protein